MTRILKAVILGTSILALAACATSSEPRSAGADASKRVSPFGAKAKAGRIANSLGVIPGGQNMGGLDPVAKTAFWGTRYDRNPNDAKSAVKFSEALREMGSNAESLSVMAKLVAAQPSNSLANFEYGKSLIANDRAFEAVRPLEKAIARDTDNWKTYSAYGVALDKIGQHKTARQQYDIALKLQPQAYSVMNNKGLSYALSGNLNMATRTLRVAAASPAGSARVRQNLALVLGFNGQTREAERLARSDLPPRIADNNTAYFRALVAQPTYWQNFDSNDVPDFDAPVAASTMPVDVAPLTPTYQAPAYQEPVFEEPETPAPAREEPAARGDTLSALPRAPQTAQTADILAQPPATTFGTNAWGSKVWSAPLATELPVQLETTSTEEDLGEEEETGA